MKTIAVLLLGAAFLCAETPVKDQGKDQRKTADTKSSKSATRTAVQATSSASPATKEHTTSARVVRPNARRASTPPSTSLTPKQKAAAALPTLPEGAQEVGANLFRYTDPQGKTWMYRKTPFGVSKWEDKPGEPQPQVERPSPAPATVTDLGDSIQFQRLTPFGPQKWTRKKSELTDEEKAMVAAQDKVGTKPSDPAKPPEKQ